MLSAFTARPIIELRQKDKSKIETILAYGDRVLVGLNTGSLRIYRVNELLTPAASAPTSSSAGGIRGVSGVGGVIGGSTVGSVGGANGGAPIPEDVATPLSSTPTTAIVGSASAATRALQKSPAPPAGVGPTTTTITTGKPTDLLREVERFSPRGPVEQLATIKEANTLVALVGSGSGSSRQVILADLALYQPLPESAAVAARTKGATCFAVTSDIVRDTESGVPEIISRLAVAVKRKVIVWRWVDGELMMGGGMLGGAGTDDGGEVVTLSEGIRSLTFASARGLVVGTNSGWSLVDVARMQVVVEDLESVGSGSAGLGAGGAAGSGTSHQQEGGGSVGGATSRLGAVGAAGMGYMGLGGYMPKPLAARLGEGRLLLARDINTAFVNLGASADTERGGSHASDADRSRKESESPAAAATTELSADRVTLDRRQIPWTTAPESIGYSYPYVVALQTAKGGTLEVRNPDTLSLLQTISLPGASQCHFPPPTVSLAHAGKGFHVSGERTVWRMQATDYDAQVRELVDARRYDEAISVLGMLEGALLVADKEQTLREVKMRKAEELFRRRKFRDSMDLFNDESVHAPPERVLRLFPREISGELSGYADRVEEEHMGPAKGEGVGGDGAAAATEHGEPAATAAGKANGEKAASAGTKAAEQATGTDAAASKSGEGGGIAAGLTRYLMGGHRKTASVDTTPAVSSPKKASKDDDGADDAASIKTKATTTSGNEFPVLEGKDLVTAVTELSSYLVGTRTRLQRLLDPTTGKLRPKAAVKGREGPLLDEAFKSTLTGEGREPDTQALEAQLQATFRLVDTTLFRAYMFSRPALAVSLFRIPNFCDPDVVSAKLQEHNRFAELVDFLHGKKLHRQALELLRKFGQSPDDEGDADKVPPALRGPQRTVTYLQTLSSEHIDMILEFSEWTLRAEGEPGMDVFLADTERAESLPRDRIVKFLGGISPRLEARYLQHIISELGDATPDFHNRLVELLIQDLRFAPRGDVWDAEMERLVAFLRESRQYSLSRAFALIPRDDPFFYEAQAVVLCNMQQHKQALEIYVFKMHDYDKAEDYCNRVHKTLENSAASNATPTTPPPSPPRSRPSPGRRRASSNHSATTGGPLAAEPAVADSDAAESVSSIYHTLLSLYLAPPAPYNNNGNATGPLLGPALSLLSRHGSRLPASSTLGLIPDDLHVRDLEPYFRGRIRAANSVVNATRVEAALRYPELVRSQAELLLGDELSASVAVGIGGAAGSGAARGGRNRRVLVGDDRMCGVCHRRLGKGVIAVLPDNAVVHYGCLNRVGGASPGGTGGPSALGSSQMRGEPVRAGGWARSTG